MAASDLESYFNIILTAEKGESVRDAIINASNALKKMSSNAGTLEGNPPEYFATKTRYLEWYDSIFEKFGFDDINDLADTEHAFQSEYLVSSGTLYGVLMKYVKPSMSEISHYENDPNTSKETKEAIKVYLETFEKVKSNIGKSIRAKGKSVNGAKDFRDYADIIRHIGDDIPAIVDNARFTKNQEYEAGEFEHSTEPHAFASFEVHLDKTDLLVKGSGDVNGKTYTPPEGKLFSSFDVNVKTRSGSAATSRAANSKRGTSSDGERELLDENGLIKGFSITENGSYDAMDYGSEGFSSISVHVTEPKIENKEFTVTFMVGGDVIGEPVKVAAYGDAVYEGPTPKDPENPNKIFSGWVPSPIRVIQDLECQAYFKDPEAVADGEIEDSWETIIKNRGANYRIGEYKTLNVGTLNNRNYGTIIFEKVFQGEGSSTSTWLSKTVVPSGIIGSVDKWPVSNARRFLHSSFKEDLSKIDDGALIVKSVVPVPKHTITNWTGTAFDGCENSMYTISHDEFWIPSIGEMWGMPSLYQSIQASFDDYYANPSSAFLHLGPSRCLVEGFNGQQIVQYNLGRTTATFENYYADEQRPEDVRIVENSSGDFDWAIKYRSTDTSVAAGYGLRTLSSWGFPTGAVYHTPYFHGMYSNGTPSAWGIYSGANGDYYPIGFCL